MVVNIKITFNTPKFKTIKYDSFGDNEEIWNTIFPDDEDSWGASREKLLRDGTFVFEWDGVDYDVYDDVCDELTEIHEDSDCRILVICFDEDGHEIQSELIENNYEQDITLNAKKYLGEVDVDIKDSPYKDYTRQDWALLWIERYGQIDGDHHKTWVLDQVARILNGCDVELKLASWSDGETEYRFNVIDESNEYKLWVDKMLGEVYDDGTTEYFYDNGIAP